MINIIYYSQHHPTPFTHRSVDWLLIAATNSLTMFNILPVKANKAIPAATLLLALYTAVKAACIFGRTKTSSQSCCLFQHNRRRCQGWRRHRCTYDSDCHVHHRTSVPSCPRVYVHYRGYPTHTTSVSLANSVSSYRCVGSYPCTNPSQSHQAADSTTSYLATNKLQFQLKGASYRRAHAAAACTIIDSGLKLVCKSPNLHDTQKRSMGA